MAAQTSAKSPTSTPLLIQSEHTHILEKEHALHCPIRDGAQYQRLGHAPLTDILLALNAYLLAVASSGFGEAAAALLPADPG
eukprot:CAMPEP_0183361476 /NCGR_PEP_ID=MMETSP0164_2-20130417/61006_1 /TAXON_ID=221442 /ORGANISM="Coccolithus pelagicus ssp braarudi, Strain PLY182g" /LENGTH=81 /DNA_ID=CAMNT_0025536071 /DNA_START=238 /DNA_END=480 /DNA_ORIENTATION=+